MKLFTLMAALLMIGTSVFGSSHEKPKKSVEQDREHGHVTGDHIDQEHEEVRPDPNHKVDQAGHQDDETKDKRHKVKK